MIITPHNFYREFSGRLYFRQIIYAFAKLYRVLPDCIFCPTKPSLSNSPALSPSPYLRKLIHLIIRKNTTPFSPNNPANPPRIKVSAREAWRFPRAPSDKIDPPLHISPPDTHSPKTLPNLSPNCSAYRKYTQVCPPRTL